MNLYNISLFVHMIGLIALFGGFVILQQAGARLRRAATWQVARTWLELLRLAPSMLIAGTVFMLASGLVMTRVQWTFMTPWVLVAMVIAVMFVVLGVLVVGRSLTRIGRASRESEGPISGQARTLLAAPVLWSTLLGMNGAALGVVWLMTTKPGWGGSIGIPLVLTVLGSFSGLALARSRRSQATERRGTPPITSRPLAHGGSGRH